MHSEDRVEIEYVCSHCNAVLLSDSQLIGQLDNCPKCHRSNAVPKRSSRLFFSLIPRTIAVMLLSLVLTIILLGCLPSLRRLTTGRTSHVASSYSLQRTREAELDWYMDLSSTRMFAAIVVAVSFLYWKYAAYRNLPSLCATKTRFSPAGAVAWYFCPIAQLWKPYQAMVDIWKGSDPDVFAEGSESQGSSFVALWWGLHLLAVVASLAFQISVLTALAEGNRSLSGASTQYAIFAVLATVNMTVTAILVVRVCFRQIQRRSRLVEREHAMDASEFIDMSEPSNLELTAGGRNGIAPGTLVAFICGLVWLTGLILFLISALVSGETSLSSLVAAGIMACIVLALPAFVAAAKSGKALAYLELLPERFSGQRLARTGQVLGLTGTVLFACVMALVPMVNRLLESGS